MFVRCGQRPATPAVCRWFFYAARGFLPSLPSQRSKTYCAQNREMMLKVLTRNIGIILLVKELFYRTYRTPLIHLPLIGHNLLAMTKVKENAAMAKRMNAIPRK